MKYVILKNLIPKVAYQTEQTDGEVALVFIAWQMTFEIVAAACPNGLLSILNVIKMFHVCVLVQRTHNSFYRMGIGDLNHCVMGLLAGF
jgi:hypothetical protein